MNSRNFLNFSGGPGALPACVLAQTQQAIDAVPEVGLSILGISHRSAWFKSVVTELETRIKTLMGLPNDYHVLFLQGGATQQYSMIPMTHLRGKTTPAEYIHTGYWSGKPIIEAQREGPASVIWSGQDTQFAHLPEDAELNLNPAAPYLHYVSNETVEGLQFHRILGVDSVPRICDMSSDFLSKPLDFAKFGLIYAHAQKNIGPAGVTVVVIKDALLGNTSSNLPGFLNYREQLSAHSIYNTPPVFAIYVVLLVVRWLQDTIGGLYEMAKINNEKAAILYQELDQSGGFYRGHAAKKDRSTMNVVFTLPEKSVEEAFFQKAEQAGFSGLQGHRSLGGARASIYNGMELADVEKLVAFMGHFRKN